MLNQLFSQALLHAGLLVSGAATLWGLYFSARAHQEPEAVAEWGGLAKRVFVVVFGGYMAAHVGALLLPVMDATLYGFGLGISAMMILGLILFASKKETSAFSFEAWYFFQLVLLLGLVALSPVITVSFTEWLVLGTLLVGVFLFLLVTEKDLQERLFEVLPLLRKVFWFGIGVDVFLSVMSLGPEAFLSPRLLFAETMLAVVILIGGLGEALLLPHLRDKKHRGFFLHEEGRWVVLLFVSGLVTSLAALSALRLPIPVVALTDLFLFFFFFGFALVGSVLFLDFLYKKL